MTAARTARRALAGALLAAFAAFAACEKTGDGAARHAAGDDGGTAPSAFVPKPAGALRLTIFELPVHGLAIAVETPAGALRFVDTGAKADERSSGKEVLGPFVTASGAREIAGITISHPDRDHFEGARYLLKRFAVREFADGLAADAKLADDYVELREQARSAGATVRMLRAGDVLDWDPALEVTVLAPPTAGIATRRKDHENDHSLVLRVRHGTQVFLLPGDIERAGAASLLAAHPTATLRADVLVAPHHGFFDDAKFAATVAPKHVVVSCQAEYADKEPREPGRLAEQLFGAVAAQGWVTAWDGTVTITSDGANSTVTASRPRR